MPTPSWDLLEGLVSSDVETLLSLSSSISVGAHEVVFDLGDEAHGVFLLEVGLVKLTLPINIADTRTDALVGERIPGHMIGWSGLLSPHRFTVKATASRQSRLLFLPREALHAFFEDRPDIGSVVFRNLARVIGQRLQVFQALWIREMQHVVKTRTF